MELACLDSKHNACEYAWQRYDIQRRYKKEDPQTKLNTKEPELYKHYGHAARILIPDKCRFKESTKVQTSAIYQCCEHKIIYIAVLGKSGE